MSVTSEDRTHGSSHYTAREVPAVYRVPTVAEDVAAGFAETPKRLPPKYFYDDYGSRLFDQICDTPEYYPMRTEGGLLAESAAAIMASVKPAHILELGSGTSRKTEYLLAAAEEQGLSPRYWPYDVCESIMASAAERLLERFPWLSIEALVGDYGAGLAHLPRPEGGCLYLFLGGSLGNFEPHEAVRVLGELAEHMHPQDRLLLGVDRVKDRAVLEAAYDDAAGVTAAFNRNVLTVLNRELDADFDPDGFAHESFFNEAASRIEMHLVARRDQRVRIGALGQDYEFPAGERLRTEISRKFTPASLASELASAGLAMSEHYQPADGAFSLVLVAPANR
jgi:L-histidine N-alpha-methyltransferase